MKNVLKVAFDVGSTTVKMLVINNKNEILLKKYERHNSDTKGKISELLEELITKYDKYKFQIIFTGSGALALSKYLEIPFTQEVIACKDAITRYYPSIDVAIELGGEDAKIIYFGTSIDERMNGTCAGGTGSFLDQMAILLNTTTEGLNELAKEGKTIYPIASRCGVFAKSDIQPLLNDGAKKEDIALSIMQAVVNQTISGLACGKPIRGNVIFLGGPLNYLSTLQDRFIKTLNLDDKSAIIPDDGRIFVALGAILSIDDNFQKFSVKDIENLKNKLLNFKEIDSNNLEPLFKSDKEYKEFIGRHKKEYVDFKDIKNYSGDVFVGIDAGSTTAKLVAIDNEGNILYQNYQSNHGTPVDTIKEMLLDLYENLPKNTIIRSSGSTGYGEMLIKSVFNLDISEIETVSHFESANKFLPGVESIIDIGGQDMKYIKVKDGNIESIMLNEACSSGCGSFIETLSKSLNISINDFSNMAIKSTSPIDLGSRCTVFMNSKIKQTQKEGRNLNDIFAGLSYSIIKNALTKVMKIRDNETLGTKIVVQGGTFLNDAILRAFEKTIGKDVVRPNIAGLMGAYGVALIALDNFLQYDDQDVKSGMLSKEEIINLKVKTLNTRCQGCENHCNLTINLFNGKKFISGNRCEKGSGNNGSYTLLPNMYEWKYQRLFSYKPQIDAKRGKIGIPRVLNMYENYPFWFTFFTKLGFEVVLSDDSNRAIYEKGIDSIPSESVCYPAKMVHGHIINLIEKGINMIFYPCIMYENCEFENSDNHFNCPIVQSYSESIRLNLEDIKNNDITFINPFLPTEKNALTKRFLELNEFKQFKIKKSELQAAIDEAILEQTKFKNEVREKGEEFLKYVVDNNEKAIVLAGRPYHLDKEVNHGIDKMINSLGLAVLTEDSICHLSKIKSKLRVVNQWAYHARVYHAADVVSQYPNLEIVNLNSFGCGLDAIITDQTEEILKKNKRLYTSIKIDEINNLGAIKIRIRSLIAAMNKRINEDYQEPYKYSKNYFQKRDKKNTILVPDMSPYHMPLLTSAFKTCGYNVVYLNESDDNTVNTGLNYVNNDACYPAILVIGQLINALKSGKYDLDNTSVIITQTGGGCRATNYIGLIRKALADANLGKVSILSINVSGLEKEQEFKFDIKMIYKLITAVLYGDLLMKLLLTTRPYEVNKGESNNLYKHWITKLSKEFNNISYIKYKDNIKSIIEEFSKIKTKKIKKPKVGIVGEILIKYHQFGNDNLVDKLEKEGAEVVVPELLGFVKYCIYNQIEKEKLLKNNKINSKISLDLLRLLKIYENPINKELKKYNYRRIVDIFDLANNVEGILSKGNQTGEGWFLTGEIVELLKNNINNIICVQPFACLPNHIVGKAVIKKMTEIYPQANITAIDYDAGASHTNQINRIKLLISVSKEKI